MLSYKRSKAHLNNGRCARTEMNHAYDNTPEPQYANNNVTLQNIARYSPKTL